MPKLRTIGAKEIIKGGTLKSLYNQVSRFIPESDIHALFYTK